MQGRNTQGVRLIRLDEGDRLVGLERIVSEGPEPDGGPLRYRVAHTAKLWKPGERPYLDVKVLEGAVGLSI